VQRFYFDHNATTPVAPPVLDAFVQALTGDFGNASSIHQAGQQARARLDQARADISAFLGATPKELVFTSGGTEADNLAVLGAVRHRPGHVITTAIEHPAVLHACRQLEDVTYVRPDSRGVVDPGDVRQALRPDTVLISVMHANNELGTIQPLAEIAAIAREAGVLIHSDGVQAAGRILVDVAQLGVDLYSISAHKMYAPKGTGALFVRRGVDLHPLLFGGRHEQGRRAGTENVGGAVALAAACRLDPESERLAALRDRLEAAVLDRVPNVAVNGAGAPRIPNTTNLRLTGIGAEAMVIALDLKGFAVSTGSACSSGSVEPSPVLIAIGLTPAEARASVRISLGRSNDEAQVDALVDAIAEAASHLRRLSPTYAVHA
jgi:cysteine desulfurase